MFSRMTVTYHGGESRTQGHVKTAIHVTSFNETEYIHEVITYFGRSSWGWYVLLGVEFVTNERNHGPLGETTADVRRATGHRLLYFSGRGSMMMDRLTMHFDYNCTDHTQTERRQP